HVPGAAHRGQRRARRTGPRARRRRTPADAGRAARGGVVPFARGCAGQILSAPAQRGRARLAAPAAAAGRSGAELHLAVAPAGAARRGRDRTQPARPLGPAARRRAHIGPSVQCAAWQCPAWHEGLTMMWRLSGVFWIAAVLLAGSTNFVVKHTVQRLDDELNSARRKTIA